jgi:hypothetical protein
MTLDEQIEMLVEQIQSILAPYSPGVRCETFIKITLANIIVSSSTKPKAQVLFQLVEDRLREVFKEMLEEKFK